MDLKQQIADAIDKDLSKQIGDRLKIRLEEADQAEKDLAQSKLELKIAKDTINRQEKTIEDLNVLKLDRQTLDKKTKDLEKREHDLELTIIKAQLESEKEKSTFGFNVALGLVRNTEFRRHLTDSQTLPSIPGPNGYCTPQNSFQTSTETNSAQ